jgi:hypothetical protein
VYGPNTNDLNFYDELQGSVLAMNNQTIILCGDWNATWDPSPVAYNIDVINMQNIPSKQRSEKIVQMARNLSITDPFRFLFPQKKDFTFVPNIAANKNRSRIDFFLISENITGECKNVKIPHNLSSKTFDHKPVEMVFSHFHCKNTQVIKDTILKDPLLTSVMKIHAIDCYNNHASFNDVFTPNIRAEISRKIGIVLSEIANIKNLRLQKAEETDIEGLALLERRIALIENRVQNIFLEIPGVEFFENLDLTADADIFFETLVITLKNEALSFQSNFYKNKNATKKNLRDQIKDLKLDYNTNKNLIFDLESRLTTIIDLELKDELSTVKNFERLNDEKITPYFLRLAKAPENNVSLETLKDENNEVYKSDKEREDSIYKFYRDLYKKPELPLTDANMTIENFLGDVALEEDVINSKLTEEERTILDRPLTIAELDNSMKNAKINSAPGIDGISNRFIQENWTLFRVPLFKYAIRCYEKGELTDNFRSAKIRLIPKKGDCSKIKNWRPISLLNCFYKIISRAIAERLKRVINKITNMGQKGYNSEKYCQEVLISLVDEIETARQNRKNGALLSLDIRKAFDTISHQYINMAYKFFNFGENFIKWLNLIGTNRKACIILEGEMYSKFFNLERGNAQGDTTSPYIFNIGYQILLFKLNYDLQIAGLIVPPDVPPDLQPPAPQPQVRNNPRKVFAFADDATLATQMEYATLNRVKKILDDFGKLSGLECNVEKTTILQIGHGGGISDEIRSLGFSIDSEITVLGLKLRNGLGNFENAWQGISEKVQRQINHWTRFNLSLPGRICIAKCMLYSQINYLGCFLPINKPKADEIGTLIESFVLNNIRIAKKRLYLSPENGGLGLFEINDFLDSQKVAWIARAKNLDEIWKIRLHLAGYGSILNCRLSAIDKNCNPILYSIVSAYERFLTGYTKHNENFWESSIFENGALFIQLRQKTTLKKEFFEADFFNQNVKKILSLKISDFFETKDRYRTWENFCLLTGLDLHREMYNELKKIPSNAKLKYTKKSVLEIKTTALNDFINRKVKGCKRYRKKIIGKEEEFIPHNIVKYSNNTDTVINYEQSKTLNGLWSKAVFSNATRTFLFKLHNNTAGYNNAVAHFVPGHSPNCTFCDVIRNQEVEDETPLHLFFTCSVSERFVESIFSWVLGEPANISRQEYFVCFNKPDHRKNYALLIISVLVKKYLWDCKQRFTIPDLDLAKIYLREELKIICFCSSKANTVLQNSGLLQQLG